MAVILVISLTRRISVMSLLHLISIHTLKTVTPMMLVISVTYRLDDFKVISPLRGLGRPWEPWRLWLCLISWYLSCQEQVLSSASIFSRIQLKNWCPKSGRRLTPSNPDNSVDLTANSLQSYKKHILPYCFHYSLVTSDHTKKTPPPWRAFTRQGVHSLPQVTTLPPHRPPYTTPPPQRKKNRDVRKEFENTTRLHSVTVRNIPVPVFRVNGQKN